MGDDFEDRMAQMRVIEHRMQKDGIMEGVELELDPIRSLKSAYLSATASATADLVYTPPTNKVLVTKNFTLTNRVAAPVLITIRDGAVDLDVITVAASDSVVIERNYRVATSIICLCSAWLTGTSYSFSFWEYPLTNRNVTPP